MDDLISKKGLLNKINAYVCGSQDKEFICKLIAEMPSVDAVEVVHCKDCRHCVGNRCRRNARLNDWRKDDEFCSYGERETDV